MPYGSVYPFVMPTLKNYKKGIHELPITVILILMISHASMFQVKI
jgi:hypothetical protein